MKIISYNINSLRKRISLLDELITVENPDIICLQEIKISNSEDLPIDFFKLYGYKFLSYGLSFKGMGGVLTASKINLEEKSHISFLYNLEDDSSEKRHVVNKISINNNIINLHNFYVPSGGSGADEKNLDTYKFKQKIEFLENMIKYFEMNKDEDHIILGDLNVAPGENDVFNHKILKDVISHTPIERELFLKFFTNCNLIDIGRLFNNDDKKLFSWFSYRSKDFLKNQRGRRLDHILISNNKIKNTIVDFKILTDFRSKPNPSDHCPILVEFNIAQI